MGARLSRKDAKAQRKVAAVAKKKVVILALGARIHALGAALKAWMLAPSASMTICFGGTGCLIGHASSVPL